jgi:hypothetical protein
MCEVYQQAGDVAGKLGVVNLYVSDEAAADKLPEELAQWV